MVVEVGGIVDVDVAAGGEVLELHPANATTQATRAAVTPKPPDLLRNLCVMSPPDVPQHSRLKQAGHGGDRQSMLADCGHPNLVFEPVTHQGLHNPLRQLHGLWQQHCRLRATRRRSASPSDGESPSRRNGDAPERHPPRCSKRWGPRADSAYCVAWLA